MRSRTRNRARALAWLFVSFVFGAAIPSGARTQDPPPADHSQEAFIAEQARTVYRFEMDGTGTREISMRIKTQSEAGVQHWGQLQFGYNAANERMDITFVRVRKADGTVITTPAEGVQDLSSPVQRMAPVYTDFRQKHVTVQALRPGDTLEFNAVTTTHTPLAPGQFWAEYDFQQQFIVFDEQLVIDIPAERSLLLKTREGYDPSIKDREGRRVYTWTRANLTRQAGEAAEKEKKSTASTEPHVPAVRLTTFESWEQIGRWYAALEAPQRVPTPEIRKKAAELTAGRQSDLEKLEALYEFVATNFRYVSLSLGMGRYQPRAAADVLREQYGDCKDKHTLLASLIDASGLKASAVLINSSAKIDPAFPSPSQFDHVITRAIASGEEVWVDTTSEVAPFRLIAPPLRNKQALVIEGDTPRLQETPANPPMKSFFSHDVEGKLDETGKLHAHVRATMRGDIELVMRTIFRSMPAAQWKDVLEGFVKGVDTPGEVANWKVGDPASLKAPFAFEFDLTVNRYADWTSNKISVALPLSASNNIGSADDDRQDTPVELGAAPMELVYKLRLQLPMGVTARAPLPVALSRDYGEYRATYAVTSGTFAAERVVTVRVSQLPAERRQDYAAFARVVTADNHQLLALESPTNPGAAAPSAAAKAADLNRSGYEALEAGNFAQAITLLKRVVELEPKDKTAWNNLGRAYMALRQLDAAIEAYQKQIEVNPYDAYAYTNLGRAYVAQRKYPEAETAFKKQLEVNPLDKYAPAHLGALYVERRQYELAIPVLEKAVALSPSDSWVQIQLGKAHLNLKQEPAALAAFDRAVELSPTPTAWNNIAYELAMAGVHLDRALQYAESAVASATAASRTLDITRADETALGVVQSLAAYWDTLGWVHFAKGDITRAERFVDASWRLAQHAEVGDHLGQIYEKLGRRDDAMSAYAMALAADSPSDEIRERLVRLTGGKQMTDELVNVSRGRLAQARSVAIPGKGTSGKTADFFVLFSQPSTVENVRFIGGDESLRQMADAIRAASFGRLFPDDVPAKILRRGILGCAPSGCTVTLLLPDDTRAVK